ncbi:hypothetical protein OG417_43325 [Actinoallomurus sp. NBC_01490]|jgi:hypothetical protein|uniref:hypothetical protein n=1 Tax=Actinoallomurus sp. NBC_01490 TaxID=2903557 RepID=UPI002E32CDAC|nr:hypothetical protein [Actinoallomurus sp. NBC_01490]
MTRSPRHLREQVKDTVSELPIQAARLAVMGVGRALLLTDRLRKDYREARESGLSPVLGRLKNDAENFTGMVVGKVAGNGRAPTPPKGRAADDSEISVGKPKPSATTRPATPPRRPAERAKPAAARPSAASRPKPATAKPTAAKPATAKPSPKPAPKPSPKPAAKARPAATEKAKQAETKASRPKARAKTAANLPISGYDEATLASVRARLRGLDAKQVGELRDYERAHAARADFLRMYENRIAKLRGGH